MKVSIIGTGYVGLVTGACFAEVGIDVVCVDIDKTKIDNLKKGILPIYEPGLEDIVVNNSKKARLHFTTSISESLDNTEVIFIAVGTPPDEDGSADLKHVLKVASEIGQYMNKYLVVTTKSTVPVGTAEKVRNAILYELKKRNVNIPFDIASNPEFLKEGAAVDDFLKPDRIVVGIENQKVEEIMRRLYKPFTLNGHSVIFMDIPSAEMTKYAANAMLATKISFINDIANLCEIIGADVNMVRKGIGSDTRIGYKFIYPGVGYGGSCFPKDVKALIKTAKEHNYDMRVLQAVEDVNNDQKSVLFNKALKYYTQALSTKHQALSTRHDLKGLTLAVWGLSFKPETDDMRDASSVVLIEKLIAAGAVVRVYDPVAMNEAKHKLKDTVYYATDCYDALSGADALFLVTEWKEFRFPDFQKMKKIMKTHVVFDGRNIYDSKEMAEYGFYYSSIGVK